MGMSAEVLAIGRYSKDLHPFLTYTPKLPVDLPATGAVVDTLFGHFGIGGSTASRELAAALGVGAWDFETHHFDPDRVDVVELERLVGAAEVRRFKAFMSQRFDFYFRPNG